MVVEVPLDAVVDIFRAATTLDYFVMNNLSLISRVLQDAGRWTRDFVIRSSVLVMLTTPTAPIRVFHGVN